MDQLQSQITALSCSNFGASSSFIKIAPDQILDVITQLKRFNIKGALIWCLFKHVCKENVDDYAKFVLNMKDRPTTCPWPNKCDWSDYEEHNVHTGSPGGLALAIPCTNHKCDSHGTLVCGGCFSVRYCSKKCQSADRKRHKKECKGVITAVKLASAQGKIYSKSIITGMIRMDDVSFEKLWEKHAPSSIASVPVTVSNNVEPPTYVRVKITEKVITVDHEGHCSGKENEITDEETIERFTTHCDPNDELKIGSDLTNKYAEVTINELVNDEVDRECQNRYCTPYMHDVHGKLYHCTVTEVIKVEVVADRIDTPRPTIMQRNSTLSACPPESRHPSPTRFALD